MKIHPAVRVVTICLCLLAVGCNSDSSSSSSEPGGSAAAGKRSFPVIKGASLANLKAKMGTDYSVTAETAATEYVSPSTKLTRRVEPHEILVTVQHTADGKIESLSADVFGPQGTDSVMDQLYKEAAETLTEGLGATSDAVSAGYWAIGLLKMHFGLAYNFSHNGFYFAFTPEKPLVKSTSPIEFKPGFVHRRLGMSPATSGETMHPPIPGSSVTQLEEILEGFEIKAKVDGVQNVYLREADTHREFVLCQMDAGGAITRIETQVVAVKEGHNMAKLNAQFWRLFADLKYKDSSHEAFIGFLERPKMEYAVGEGDKIGAAAIYLPVGMDGKRSQLNIWAEGP